MAHRDITEHDVQFKSLPFDHLEPELRDEHYNRISVLFPEAEGVAGTIIASLYGHLIRFVMTQNTVDRTTHCWYTRTDTNAITHLATL